MRFRFVDNTHWQITYVVNDTTGKEISASLGTYGGWGFSDKATIQVRYRMHTFSSGTLSSSHKLTLKTRRIPENALYLMSTPNIMRSIQLSADATSSGWSRQNMHFQTASNNYSRVDFIATGTRYSVGLVKEDLNAVNKQLLTSKAYFGNGNTTHWQLHSNAVAISSETGYDGWVNEGHYNTAMNKVCSVISTDYWEENLFGNGADLPANFGHVDISPQSGVHQDWTPTQWALDDDGNIILTVITNSWPLDNLIHYSKITKDGQYVDGSAKIKYPEIIFSSQADLINGYNGADSYNPCLLYTSPSPRDMRRSRMPSSA